MLEAEGVDFNEELSAHNILEEDGMREEMKDFSDWPTFPQVCYLNPTITIMFKVYLNGEFYGGCDIMYEDYKNEKLRGILLEAKLTLPEH
jgi:monothiol glutaredoxin